MKSGILQVIQDYDQKREFYIASLEDQIKELEARNNELMTLVMKGQAIHERAMLQMIMHGEFPKTKVE